MAGLGIDGLSSGLDTTSLINSLMQVEAAPQRALQTRVSSTNSRIAALQGINSRVASLATTAKELAKPEALASMKATASTAAASATAATTASAGSLTFEVKSLAAAHGVLTGVVADPGGGTPPSLTLTRADGVPVDIALDSWDPQAMATAINAAGAGVSAAAVHVGGGQYRLKITAAETGAASSFTLGGSVAAAPQTLLAQGSDAEISLGAGASIFSATNTFSGLMAGVDVTVATVTEANKPVTITVAKDTAATTKKVGDLVAALGVVLSDIADRTKATTEGTSGILVGDSGMRLLRDALSDAASGLAGGFPLAEMGVELKRDGTVVFDSTKLTAMMAADPAKATAMMTALAERVASIAGDASNATSGSISQTITSQQGEVKDLQERVGGWDARLATRRAGLERQFASLETALSGMKSQSSWLGSAIAGLPSYA